ncbi:MAG: lysophospholipase [Deltaproteobacteria bacterium]|nr:lysophospholipase [Deltaproteobacteria bacterium]
MKHQEGHFKGIGEMNIYYQCWLPEMEPKAVLLVVHGLAEHSGRYMNLVNHLVPLGYAVYGLDHVGHGRSEGARVYVRRFHDFTDTLGIFSRMIREIHPGRPLFLVGHSMGGLIAAIYLLDHQEEFTGAVLSGPGVKIPDNISPVTILLGRFFSAVMPKVGLISLDAEGVSRDKAVVKAYLGDPLVYTGKTTARLAAELLRAMKRVEAEAAGITLPLLIVQGGKDRLVNPDGARMLHKRVGSPDKTLRIYEGLYHEVFNEPEHPKVLDHVEEWLETRVLDLEAT